MTKLKIFGAACVAIALATSPALARGPGGGHGGGGAHFGGGGAFGPREWEYDCIAEWGMRNEEDFNEIMRIFADPVIGSALRPSESRDEQ